jgi:hypothetical protein
MASLNFFVPFFFARHHREYEAAGFNIEDRMGTGAAIFYP